MGREDGPWVIFARSLGRAAIFQASLQRRAGLANPAMNCRATIGGPSGTGVWSSTTSRMLRKRSKAGTPYLHSQKQNATLGIQVPGCHKL
jgi:hypothetical protein